MFFSSKDGIYYTTSRDFGENFTKVKQFKNDIDIEKGKYFTNVNLEMCINDIYVSKNEPKNIKILPDVYKNFYNDFLGEKKVLVRNIESPKKMQEQKQINKPDKVYYENLSDLNNEDFYKILLEKKKQKDLARKDEKAEPVTLNSQEELEKLKYENEKLKKALKNVMKF